MAISAQQLTIYLYSAHRAVIFAIAQLSCLIMIMIPSVCLSRCSMISTKTHIQSRSIHQMYNLQ